MAQQLERIPPHNDEAEKSVLGAVLQDKEVFFEVSAALKAEDFYSEAHREIYNAMMDLYSRNEPIDIITVCESLQRRGSLETAGGRSYVALLSSAVPTTANAVQYAKIVSEKAILRRLISASSSAVKECFDDKLDPKVILDNAEKNIFEIAKNRQSKEFLGIREVLNQNLNSIEEAQRNGGKMPGLPTGYTDLDNMLTGLHKSDMVIIAARPSMGKTALALNIAQYAAIKQKARVAIFSLEMSAEDLGLRMLAMEARKDSKKLRTGNVTAEDWAEINMALATLSNTDVVIDDTPGITPMEIRNKCRRLQQEKKVDLIVIDYLQIMGSDGAVESRQQEVSNMSRYLKQLAREMECPVIVLSQLSRASEKRQGTRKPMMSDLRDSGAIEQDADVIMFIHREDYYRDSSEQKDNTAEIIIAKQRKGETGSVFLTWLPQFTKFVNKTFNEYPEQ